MSHVIVIFFLFQGYSSLKEWRFWYAPVTFCHNFSFQVYAAPFQWRLLIYIGKFLWRRVLEANKKHVPLKSYSLFFYFFLWDSRIRLDSIDQILKNKEKVTLTCNISILTKITDQKIQCVYVHISQITKNWGPRLCNSLCHADNRKYFSGLSLMQNQREEHVLPGEGKGKNLEMLLLRKDNFIMINEFGYDQTWEFSPIST